MDYREEYKRKLISAAEAAQLVKSHMWVDYGCITCFPLLIDEALARRAGELEDVKIRAVLSLKEPEVLKADPTGRHFIFNDWFFSEHTRRYHDLGHCFHIPYNLNEGPKLYREFLRDEVDIAFIEVTPMDKHGFFNFGATVTNQMAICQVAKTVVLEVNETQPWVSGGYDELIHISQVDYIVENDKHPIPELPIARPTPLDEAIAQHITRFIENESTIQLGIGGIPNAIGALLIQYGLKDLGIHSEMFTDSMVDLIQQGVVTGRKKTLNPGKVVMCLAAGTRKLYQFMDHNPVLAGFPSDYTNDPYVIAQNYKQIAINSALKVDLQGQVCSEAIGQRHISGTGGQLNFTRGAFMAPGGKAFICLPSTYQAPEGKMESRIVPALAPSETVTVPAVDVSYIVTEFGAVNLKGKTCWQRARLLISIAHPDFRAELERAARAANLLF